MNNYKLAEHEFSTLVDNIEVKDNGGSAFPVGYPIEWSNVSNKDGMTLRDYFANSATTADLKCFIPDTIGGVAKLLVDLGIIKPYTDISRAYTNNDYIRLHYWAKYKHADAMIAERNRD